MNPDSLRAFWRLVESTPSRFLLEQEDEHLTRSLLHRFSKLVPYSERENAQLKSIICWKIPLIRELAGRRS